MVTNGVVSEPTPGVFIGARVIDEAVGSLVLPSGMTAYGQLAVNGTYEVADDTVPIPDGFDRALRFETVSPFTNYGVAVDAFDPYSAEGEWVTLTRFPNSGHLGTTIWNMSGLTDAGIRSSYIRIRNNAGTMRMQWIDRISGGETFHGSEADSGITAAAGWFWTRTRVDLGVNPSVRVRSKIWIGDFADEPVPWVMDVTDNSNNYGLVGAVGWGDASFPNSPAQVDVAFFSFSSDPDSDAPPSPNEVLTSGDIVPPTVTVNPLQDTWVGLVGSPFQLVD